MNDNRTLRQQLTASLAAVPVRNLPGNGASFPTTTQEAAVARLSELRTDRDWTRRYFAGDHEATWEHALLIWQAEHGDAPYACALPEPKSAADLRREAELRFDGPIPAEFLDAISAQERVEREVRR